MHSVRSGRKRRLAALGAALSLALGIAAGSASPAVAHGAEVQYVALGDSYSTGQGAGGETGDCLRSPGGYPTLVHNRTPAVLVADATCRDATTTTVLTRQLPARPDPSVDLVTMTVGGNDAGFAQLTVACADGRLVGACLDVLTITRGEELRLALSLGVTYVAARVAYPNARIVVLGYPHLYNAPVDYSSVPAAVNAAADRLDGIIAATARRVGVTFVDVREEFRTHGAGIPPDMLNPYAWIGQDPRDGVTYLHPTASGHSDGYYQALVNDRVLP